ncbi:MAG: DNA-directed RNA polymerase subunit D [Candidatus Aenigmatarchaeota archaeon]
MKIRILSKSEDKLKFVLEDATTAFANTLRRIMISEVPILAIDYVEFYDNTSALFDEIIAHRLGLIPLVFDPSKFNFTTECKCGGKGCPACQVFFALEKTGPSMVYSSDLKSSDKNVKPTSPDFPIVKLLKDQKIKLEAIAVLGRGKEHAKFQAANAAYSYLPSIEVTGEVDEEKIVKACPKNVLDVKNKKLFLKDPYNCDICKACEEASDGKVKVLTDSSKFVFTVETISGLDPVKIVEKSIEIIQEKAKNFKEQLKDL